ncbi:MAG: hypothetical protein ACI4C7_04405 [Clostridia bacterium]
MNKYTKITLDELMKRKEQMLEAKKKKKTRELYIPSLDGTITIQEPSKELVHDVRDMEAGEDDKYMTYQSVIDPPLKSQELQDAFECQEPMDIVDKLFADGEIPQISVAAMKLAGYMGGVKEIEEIKNS